VKLRKLLFVFSVLLPTLLFAQLFSFPTDVGVDFPSYWHTEGTAEFVWDDEIYYKGPRSLCIEKSVDSEWVNAGWYTEIMPIPEREKVYVFRALVKTEKATGPTYLVISWFKEGSWLRNSPRSFVLMGDCDWVELVAIDVPPKSATHFQLAFRSDNNKGKAWMDEPTLEIVPFSTPIDVNIPPRWEIMGKGKLRKEGEALVLRDTEWTTGWCSQKADVDATYESYFPLFHLSAEVETKDADGRIFLSLAWFDEKGWKVNSRSAYVKNPKARQKVELWALPPVGARETQIILRDDYELTGEIIYKKVALEIYLFPCSGTPFGDEISAPYSLFLTAYPSSPFSLPLFLTWSRTELDRGNSSASLQILDTALKSLPEKEIPILREKGEIYIQRGEWDKAIEVWEGLMRRDKRLAGEANFELGECWKYKEGFGRAIEYYRKAQELEPQGWFASRAFLNIAYCKENESEYQTAFSLYKQTLEKYRDQKPLATLGMGLCSLMLGKYREGFRYFKELLDTYGERLPEEILNAIIGDLSWALPPSGNRFYKEMWQLRELLGWERIWSNEELSKISMPLFFALSRVYCKIGNYDKAKSIWQKITSLPPHNNEVYTASSLLLKFFDYLPKTEKQGEIVGDMSLCSIGRPFNWGRPPYKVYLVYDVQEDVKEKTIGDWEWKNVMMKLLKMFYGGLGLTEIEREIGEFKKGDEVKEEDIGGENTLILSIGWNSPLVKRLGNLLPIKISEGRKLIIGGRIYEGEDLFFLLNIKSPLNPDKRWLWVWSASPSVLQYFTSFAYPPSPTSYSLLGYVIGKGDPFKARMEDILEAGFLDF